MKPIQTPFFRIREQSLQYDVSLLRQSLADNWGNYIMGYSVKTNSLPWLLNYLKNQGFYAEVVSRMEYDLALRLGFPGRHIIYNGPIKDPAPTSAEPGRSALRPRWAGWASG